MSDFTEDKQLRAELTYMQRELQLRGEMTATEIRYTTLPNGEQFGPERLDVFLKEGWAHHSNARHAYFCAPFRMEGDEEILLDSLVCQLWTEAKMRFITAWYAADLLSDLQVDDLEFLFALLMKGEGMEEFDYYDTKPIDREFSELYGFDETTTVRQLLKAVHKEYSSAFLFLKNTAGIKDVNTLYDDEKEE